MEQLGLGSLLGGGGGPKAFGSASSESNVSSGSGSTFNWNDLVPLLVGVGAVGALLLIVLAAIKKL